MKKQPYPTLLIKRSDLTATPCSDYTDLPHDKLFNPFEEMEKRGRLGFNDVSWLIEYCKKAQTLEIIEYYLSLNPSAGDVAWLIANCSLAQTHDMMTYFKSLNPPPEQVARLITNCPFAQKNI